MPAIILKWKNRLQNVHRICAEFTKIVHRICKLCTQNFHIFMQISDNPGNKHLQGQMLLCFFRAAWNAAAWNASMDW